MVIRTVGTYTVHVLGTDANKHEFAIIVGPSTTVAAILAEAGVGWIDGSVYLSRPSVAGTGGGLFQQQSGVWVKLSDVISAATQTALDLKMLATGSNAALPAVDPAVVGRLWNDTGTVKVSAG
jgi:hypothetical protein